MGRREAASHAAIANGGTVYRPHVVRMIEKTNPDGHIERLQVASEVLHKINLAPKALETVQLGLWKVVNEEGGTGSNARVAGLDISGKTGTVQVIAQHTWGMTAGLPYKYKDHAWFASYATKDNPQMVVVIFVEHGGHGAVDAAPLAKLMYETRFRAQMQHAGLATAAAGMSQ
jgi:penicillin-binding protein 2